VNIFSLSNIEIRIRHLPNTYLIMDIHLILRYASWIIYILSRKENLWIPWKFYMY